MVVQGETLKEGDHRGFEEWKRQGWDENDSPLSNDGKQQAENLKSRLESYEFNDPTLYSGHLIGMLYTAVNIAELCNIKINIEPSLANQEEIVEAQETFAGLDLPGEVPMLQEPLALTRKQSEALQRKHSTNPKFSKYINDKHVPAQIPFPSYIPPKGDVIIVTSRENSKDLIKNLSGLDIAPEAASIFHIQSSVTVDLAYDNTSRKQKNHGEAYE